MSIQALGYIGFAVEDLTAWDGFATGVLGLMPGEASEGQRRYRLDDQSWRISIEKGKADDIAFVGFEVSGPEELAAMSVRLTEGGVPVAAGDADLATRRGVIALITCADPQGLPIEIYYGATLRTEHPFISPAGVPSFVTGEQGLGHIVLTAGDITAARHFYQDLLGFRLSDIISMDLGPQFRMEMEFFHCNPRHHTLALMPVPAPKRLHHFMVQAPTLDAVGFALERAQSAGAVITASLGRHTNDQMVSFYAATPAGFEVEFGFGAQEIDDLSWRVARHDRPSSWGHKRMAR